MARYIWCRERMRFVEPHEVIRRPAARSHLPAPSVQVDTMPHTWHPATGEYLDSKAAFRRRTREAGCIEVGDQAPTVNTPRGPDPKKQKAERVQAIKQAMRSQGVDVL